MSPTILIDYGCHSFSYRLAKNLRTLGVHARYFANGSLESPNLSSLSAWAAGEPDLVRVIRCRRPYGKVSLRQRVLGELEWSDHCVRALTDESPAAVIVSCVPLAAMVRIQLWTERNRIPLVYWLQDLQGRAIHDLLGRKAAFAGRAVGAFASLYEEYILEKSRMVITIAKGHECALPQSVRAEKRYELLQNWANIDEFPEHPRQNRWADGQGLSVTRNVIYSGTLGLKHDLGAITALAKHLQRREDVRVVVVSSGEAADILRSRAACLGLTNLMVLPFQPYEAVPEVLSSASVLIAPLDPSAGSFCVPSKVLSYLCAGRPTVIAIDTDNPAAAMIEEAGAGIVTKPGNTTAFVGAVANYLDDEPMRELASRRAREYAERTFRLDNVTAAFRRILARCAVEQPGRAEANKGAGDSRRVDPQVTAL